jgi:ABC-2 type transport system permease protein
MTITVTAGLLASNLVSNPLLPTAVWSLLPALLFWFILGYTLYAFAFAAAGALIARIEEVQFATAPFTVLLIMGFLLTYATIASPDAWWVHLLSFFPPFTPILMPARLAVGHLAIWEMPLAALIMLASIYALARLAGRIYAQGLVHSGARLGWLDALRSH